VYPSAENTNFVPNCEIYNNEVYNESDEEYECKKCQIGYALHIDFH